MCAACVAQGIGYVGTALAGLQVMGARAKARRRSSEGEGSEVDVVEDVEDVAEDEVVGSAESAESAGSDGRVVEPV